MSFTKSDWEDLCKALDDVNGMIAQFQSTADRAFLNNAVLALWRFAEYSMNVGLELQGERTDRGHHMEQSARLLYADGFLQRDYADTVGKLEKFRRKVDYLSYSRDRSVHFNRENVVQALVEVQMLREELERELRKARKLS